MNSVPSAQVILSLPGTAYLGEVGGLSEGGEGTVPPSDHLGPSLTLFCFLVSGTVVPRKQQAPNKWSLFVISNDDRS